MYLSKLIYEVVKNSVYSGDTSFTLDSFLRGEFDGNPDYEETINNVFPSVNEALSRLNDLDKIPYQIEEIETNNGEIEINPTPSGKYVKRVLNVAQMSYDGSVYCLQYMIVNNTIRVNRWWQGSPILVEYQEDLPFFSRDDIPSQDINGSLSNHDVDLYNYGITNTMCNYVIEYSMAKLTETVDATLSNMHITRAEQYFANIKEVKQNLVQKVVQKKYSI